jgi:hypothetical protein
MTPQHLVGVVLLGLLTGLALLRLGPQAVHSNRYRILLALRLGMLSLLALLFLQPSFNLTTMHSSPPKIVVLLDNSQSMQLFNAESLYTVLHQSLARLGSAAEVPVLLFGDSLRSTKRSDAPRFSDITSLLPANAHVSPHLGEAERILLISDGNWSNALLPRQLFAQRECFYLTPPPFTPRPHLAIEALDAEIITTAHRPALATILISGYTLDSSALEIIWGHRGGTLSKRIISRAGGFFADTLQLPLKRQEPGSVLWTASVRFQRDSTLYAGCRFTQTITPSRFSVALHSTAPRLDNRFLRLALSRDSIWSVSTDSEPVDILFVMDGSAGARLPLGRLKPAGTFFFSGCAPQGAISKEPLKALKAEPLASEPLKAFIAGKHLPPLSPIAVSEWGSGKRFSRLLSATVGKDKTEQSVAFLARGEYRAQRAWYCAARDWWKWDFWPQGFNSDTTGVARFSDAVLSILKEELLSQASNTLLCYGIEQPSPAGRALRLRAHLPSGINRLAPFSLKLHLQSTSSATAYDTSIDLAGSASRIIEVALGGQRAGSYLLSSSVAQGNFIRQDRDSIVIASPKTELMIRGANSQLLSQCGQTIEGVDSLSLAQFFDAGTARAPRTRNHRLTFDTTWLTLTILMVLLGAEWFMRKRWQLE